jgi:thiamine-monophosphate kinase
MLLSQLGEFGLLAELERRGLVQRIGDDVAELSGGWVVTQDTLVEGVHFRLDWTSWRDLGFKAAAVNLSDLAAAGAEPAGLVVGLGLPGQTELAAILELYEGLQEAGVAVVGGDTTRADGVHLAITALGWSERVPGRAGARPGDVLVVTGPLGASAAGFHALRTGAGGPAARAHLRPPIRLGEGRELARTAHAMLDLSDGLASDAARLAERSGCRVAIDAGSVPVAEGVAEAAERLGLTVHELALGFGEDYELLAAVREPGRFTPVGRCERGSGVEIRLEGGLVELAGWDHFR